MLIGSSNCSSAPKTASARRSSSPAGRATSSKLSMPAVLSAPKPDHDLEIRKRFRRKIAGNCGIDLGRDRTQRGEIVVVLVARAQDQGPAAGLPDRIVEFVRTIGRIDVDEDQPGERRAELRQHPFAVVGGPDADPVALLQAEAPEPDREVFGPCEEFAVSPAHVLMPRDQCEALRVFLRHPSQERPDRLAEKRRRTRAMHVGLRECGHGVRSRRSAAARRPACCARGCDRSRLVSQFAKERRRLLSENAPRADHAEADGEREAAARSSQGRYPVEGEVREHDPRRRRARRSTRRRQPRKPRSPRRGSRIP